MVHLCLGLDALLLIGGSPPGVLFLVTLFVNSGCRFQRTFGGRIACLHDWWRVGDARYGNDGRGCTGELLIFFYKNAIF